VPYLACRIGHLIPICPQLPHLHYSLFGQRQPRGRQHPALQLSPLQTLHVLLNAAYQTQQTNLMSSSRRPTQKAADSCTSARQRSQRSPQGETNNSSLALFSRWFRLPYHCLGFRVQAPLLGYAARRSRHSASSSCSTSYSLAGLIMTSLSKVTFASSPGSCSAARRRPTRAPHQPLQNGQGLQGGATAAARHAVPDSLCHKRSDAGCGACGALSFQGRR
jgi:hypothetical protein